MKVQFGTALASEASANAYITIPGLRGLPSREVSVKNLANIIQARIQEILEYVIFHIRQIGLEHKLNGGIILTGGGARLKHIIQLTEYVTGLGARIGYPNEHLAGNSNAEFSSPIYATAVGLVINSLQNKSGTAEAIAAPIETKTIDPTSIFERVIPEQELNIETSTNEIKKIVDDKPETIEKKMKRSFLDKYVDKIKNFLENAE
jgi:cell division protein FtsA